MDVYGIWSKGRKQWFDCGFALGDGRFTQHRSIAVVALNRSKADLYGSQGEGASPEMWEEGGFAVCALGDDGLPVVSREDEEGDDILIDETLPRRPLSVHSF